jgi:hypothetical protein
MTPKREVVSPFSDKFSPVWELWKEYKQEAFKFTFKSSISEQGALNKLVKLSGGDENTAIEIVEESIANQWEGFYYLKQNSTSNGNTKIVDIAKGRESVNNALDKRFGKG